MATFAHGNVEIDYDDLPGPHGSEERAPVVLGHSFLFTKAMWMFQLSALRDLRRVVNVDLRGHGRSSPAPGPVTMDELADELLALLDHLRIERAILAGLSIGGMTSMRVAARHPDRVAGLVLIDTQARAERRSKRIAYDAMAAVGERAGNRVLVPLITPIFFGPHFRREDPSTVRSWQNVWREADEPSTRAVLAALNGRADVTGELSSIRAPTLVLHGEDDTAVPPERGRDLAAHIPGAIFQSIPRAGHVAAIEASGEVTRRMVEFISRIPE